MKRPHFGEKMFSHRKIVLALAPLGGIFGFSKYRHTVFRRTFADDVRYLPVDTGRYEVFYG